MCGVAVWRGRSALWDALSSHLEFYSALAAEIGPEDQDCGRGQTQRGAVGLEQKLQPRPRRYTCSISSRRRPCCSTPLSPSRLNGPVSRYRVAAKYEMRRAGPLFLPAIGLCLNLCAGGGQHSCSEQRRTGFSIHVSLQGLQSVNLALSLTVAPRQFDGVPDSIDVSV